MTEPKWRISSYSQGHECVETAVLPEVTLVRDSKAPDAGHFAVSAVRWRSFLSRVKAGRFDR
ncbi:uncharacterized protein DUF397 [Saccharopolyspora erythraea NRRL 2338]|uniref:Uncharacterized protein n=2 Tax=Saccharopolyspora erythraea TaxID=1836 RepID=A4FPD2_SACEN|nr:DUF397 domain-containing protein [Saccharopolyspora erythraea]EQD86702.1 hypothetical protein N599_08380 [Saccharopolyspora erythraea D]PFG99548.1 uncharacterized protein DUF397 [Saccharopolyspora erythraea NRRL 2338]QRK89448.1 DUF397 domain-containing protein [Saccharopolyspora erythraea]CAM05907.1 hypothetical protein SACE_6741 [Saccharopolyspora erythraea NRRL 2338]